MGFLGVYNLAQFHSKDPKTDLENRSMLIKVTVIWSHKHRCGSLVIQCKSNFPGTILLNI